MTQQSNPLIGPPPPEVPLPNAPLVRVIAQVSFPSILRLQEQEFIAPFQEAIRKTYPNLQQEKVQGLSIGPQGIAPGFQQFAWRFSDFDGKWRVSITPDFLAIETTSYTSRSDFFSRLRFVLDEFNMHAEPAGVLRLGVRYIDRVIGTSQSELTSLVRSEVLGVIGTSLSEHLQLSVTETLFSLPGSNDQIHARWGMVPALATVDPNAIEPIDETSWVLDLDMFSTEKHSFVPEEIEKTARRYAERIYSVFRWAVTDDFLRQFGGRP